MSRDRRRAGTPDDSLDHSLDDDLDLTIDPRYLAAQPFDPGEPTTTHGRGPVICPWCGAENASAYKAIAETDDITVTPDESVGRYWCDFCDHPVELVIEWLARPGAIARGDER